VSCDRIFELTFSCTFDAHSGSAKATTSFPNLTITYNLCYSPTEHLTQLSRRRSTDSSHPSALDYDFLWDALVNRLIRYQLRGDSEPSYISHPPPTSYYDFTPFWTVPATLFEARETTLTLSYPIQDLAFTNGPVDPTNF
jgi:hypothetical protein